MNGQWFPKQTIQFQGGPNVLSVSPPTGYSFTMTAGDFGDGSFGYTPSPLTGSISNEPIPGQILALIQSGTGATVIYFLDDIFDLLTGKHLYVDSVDLGLPAGGDWEAAELIPGTWFTGGLWENPTPIFEDEGVYFVEIK